MEGIGSKHEFMRKALAHDVRLAVSCVIFDGSAWTANASSRISDVARETGQVSPQQSVHAVRNTDVSCEIPGRFTEQSRGSAWIPENSTCHPIPVDGISQKSGGNRSLQANTAGSLTGFFRESPDTRKNPVGSPRNLSYGVAICEDFLRFQQEISPFRRTKRKIRREIPGKNRGISGIQCPVDRAQACPSKHPDGYREVPF
ncbi:MAG TPA: hypothetical protein VK753_12195 [Xanthomonadaceae bacterium]|jgi:hypothetical protein|nr:hypothetical protein [Xanthomonadaceae bacterium]